MKYLNVSVFYSNSKFQQGGSLRDSNRGYKMLQLHITGKFYEFDGQLVLKQQIFIPR